MAAKRSVEAEPERRRAVSFAHSPQLLRTALLNTRYGNRAALVVSLIQAYGLLDKMNVVAPPLASMSDLTSFHASYYIEYLQEQNSCHDDDGSIMEEYGLGYDCPLFDGVYDYVCAVSGSSIAMADQLVRGDCSIAINWYGGWHHAKRDRASGFCYCNDIVMAILRLQRQFKQVLYIDLDIHHGDGVEEAFYHSPNVLTLSLHKFTPGFFPGTGDVGSVGEGRGVYRCVNVPLQDGVTDDQYVSLFKSVTDEVLSWFSLEAVVLQCGADCLSGDEIGTFNLTLEAMGTCLRHVLDWDRPTLLLGGGGYCFPNTARCWAYLTSTALNVSIPTDIPEHSYFHHYGPAFELTLLPSNRSNLNTAGSLADTLSTIRNHMTKLNESDDNLTKSHDYTSESLQTESHDHSLGSRDNTSQSHDHKSQSQDNLA